MMPSEEMRSKYMSQKSPKKSDSEQTMKEPPCILQVTLNFLTAASRENRPDLAIATAAEITCVTKHIYI